MEDHHVLKNLNQELGTRTALFLACFPQVEYSVNCVVVGFIADMALAEAKGIKGLDKARAKMDGE